MQIQREKKYSGITFIKDYILLDMTLKVKFSKDKLSHRIEGHNSKNAFLKWQFINNDFMQTVAVELIFVTHQK